MTNNSDDVYEHVSYCEHKCDHSRLNGMIIRVMSITILRVRGSGVLNIPRVKYFSFFAKRLDRIRGPINFLFSGYQGLFP